MRALVHLRGAIAGNREFTQKIDGFDRRMEQIPTGHDQAIVGIFKDGDPIFVDGFEGGAP